MWEIDNFGVCGERTRYYFTFTTRTVSGNTINTKQGLKILKKGIIYAMDWSKDKIDFFVDII
jgi:hypothetical protein